jgi:hypothetical protein
VLLVLITEMAFGDERPLASATYTAAPEVHWLLTGHPQKSALLALAQLPAAASTARRLPDPKAIAGGGEAEDAPAEAEGPPKAPSPTERLPAGSPVSFPIDI